MEGVGEKESVINVSAATNQDHSHEPAAASSLGSGYGANGVQ